MLICGRAFNPATVSSDEGFKCLHKTCVCWLIVLVPERASSSVAVSSYEGFKFLHIRGVPRRALLIIQLLGRDSNSATVSSCEGVTFHIKRCVVHRSFWFGRASNSVFVSSCEGFTFAYKICAPSVHLIVVVPGRASVGNHAAL